MENILFNTSKVWIAEAADNGNMRARFVLCDFGVNLNGVQLNRETIESWMGSMVNKPLVGKITRGLFGEKEDFAGHEMRKTYIKDDAGNMTQVVTFGTNAYGTFVDIGIEEVDGVECLVATAEIWNRFPKTVQLIKDRIAAGTLHTSWEIAVNTFTMTAAGVKVIDDGLFEGLCMLGAKVQPAFDSSRLLEVAEADVDDELISAMEDDMKETTMTKDEISEVETQLEAETEIAEETSFSETVEAQETSEDVAADSVIQGEEEIAEEAHTGEDVTTASEEVASLTVHDLYDRIFKALRVKFDRSWPYIAHMFPEEHTVWVRFEDAESELDYVLFVYEVIGDDVLIDDGTPVKLTVSIASINETLAQKDAAIAAALSENAELKAKIDELTKIKAEYDKIQEQKAKDEIAEKQSALRAYALKSGFFTDGELSKGNAKKLIDALDKAGIDQMIAARYMAQLSKNAEKPVETSAANDVVTTAVDLTAEDVKPVRLSAVQVYLNN